MRVYIFQLIVACLLAYGVITAQGIRQPFASGRPPFAFNVVSRVNSVVAVNGESKSTLASQLQGLTGKDNIFGSILQNVEVFKRGFRDLIPSFQNAWRLREKRRKEGPLSISYEETKQIEVATTDAMLLMSKAFFFSVAKNWFLYSNIVSPLLSANNPWVWVQLFPSTFDDPKFKAIRERAIQQRRSHALLGAVQQLQKEAMEDVPAKQRQERKQQLEVISKAMDKKSSLVDAYDILEPYLLAPVNSRQLKSIRFNKIPSKVVKDFLHSTGTDGVPNLPVINRLNHGPFRKFFDGLVRSDEFLSRKGLSNLTPGDIKLACRERGIAVEHKPAASLRKELGDWMTLANRNVASPELAVNPFERRVALFALNVARDFPHNDFGHALRALSN
jgi:hypothetical protein